MRSVNHIFAQQLIDTTVAKNSMVGLQIFQPLSNQQSIVEAFQTSTNIKKINTLKCIEY